MRSQARPAKLPSVGCISRQVSLQVRQTKCIAATPSFGSADGVRAGVSYRFGMLLVTREAMSAPHVVTGM